jgi:ribosomal protein L13E
MDELSSQNAITASVALEIPKLSYEINGSDRLLAVILKKQEAMERELHDLKVTKILEETQLPPELLKANGLFPTLPKRKLKRGRGFRPLLRSEIEEAKQHSGFGAQQAKYLGVHKATYAKYAKLYGLWEPQPNLKGKKRNINPDGGKYPLNRILNGEFDSVAKVNDWMVKRKLLKTDIFPRCCSICGYDKTRLGGTYPILLLDHMDGNRRNFKRDNLRYLCWNCTVECGRGYLTRMFRSFDRDWKP